MWGGGCHTLAEQRTQNSMQMHTRQHREGPPHQTYNALQVQVTQATEETHTARTWRRRRRAFGTAASIPAQASNARPLILEAELKFPNRSALGCAALTLTPTHTATDIIHIATEPRRTEAAHSPGTGVVGGGSAFVCITAGVRIVLMWGSGYVITVRQIHQLL